VVLTTETGKTEGPRFHSRVLGLGSPIPFEDITTGSAHCSLAVVYGTKFNAVGTTITASQGGKRQGQITVVWDGKTGKEGGRVKLRGNVRTGMYPLLAVPPLPDLISQSLKESSIYNSKR
jgi:predicted PhzF superfamily epimerase YddE/YHI9